ncbi:MAG: glycerol-3-phosphate dehydrogenase/oxidase [Bacillota bacterium]
MSSRRAMLAKLRENQHYDLVVIGGGITGVGVAYEAAARGARVAVLEQGDFASGTSSRSTKLIHGGIRYLKHFDFRLVREGVQERQHLIAAAPYLVHPTQFVYPVHQGDPDPFWALRIGLLLYDWFAGRSNLLRHRVFPGRTILQEEPQLRAEGLTGGALYADCLTDDARLTVEVAKAAARKGAVLVNYLPVQRFLYDQSGRVTGVEAVDRLGGGEPLAVYGRAVLNATGPWADIIRRLDDPAAPPTLRTTKGVHITVPHARLPLRRPVVMHAADGRLMFAVPRGGFTYLGTTDTDYTGDPAAVAVDLADVTYILSATNRTFPAAQLTQADVVSAWAGLRSLAAAGDGLKPSQVSRDYRLHVSRSGLVSVAGGKLTAFQAMARSILQRLIPGLVTSELRLDLPGVDRPSTAAEFEPLVREAGLPAGAAAELWFRHGSQVPAVLARLAPAGSLEPRARMLAAEAAHAVEDEFAVTLTDALHRRTAQLLFSPDNGLGAAEAAAEAMGARLGWSEEERAAQVQAYRDEVAAMMSWRI